MPTTEKLPTIYVHERDYEPLAALLDSPLAHRFRAEAEALRFELDRAVIVRDQLPANVVAMRSMVDYVDVDTGRRARVKLVYPWEANPNKQRVSVLAPLGAALIGVPAGATMPWITPTGRKHTWHVEQVRDDDEW